MADSGSAHKSAIALRNEEGQRSLLTERVQAMVAEVAGSLKGAAKLPQAKAAAVFNEHQHELVEAAQAHAELLQWEAFTEGLAGIEDAGTKQVLTWLRDLFGLTLIEKHLSWYLMNGRISMQRARTVGPYINRLLTKLRPHALDLVDAFGYTDAHLRASIASGAERNRQDEARDYARKLRASGDAAIDEKVLLLKAAHGSTHKGQGKKTTPKRKSSTHA
jgi:acyl-CoA oxidase